MPRDVVDVTSLSALDVVEIKVITVVVVVSSRTDLHDDVVDAVVVGAGRS